MYKKALLSIFAVSFCLASCEALPKYVKTTSPPPSTSQPGHYFAGVDQMKLYPKPNYNEHPVAKVAFNEKVKYLKEKEGWVLVKVIATGAQGWVEKAYLEKKKGSAEKHKTGKGVVRDSQEGSSAPATHPEPEETTKKQSGGILSPKAAEAAPLPPEKAGEKKPQSDMHRFDAF